MGGRQADRREEAWKQCIGPTGPHTVPQPNGSTRSEQGSADRATKPPRPNAAVWSLRRNPGGSQWCSTMTTPADPATQTAMGRLSNGNATSEFRRNSMVKRSVGVDVVIPRRHNQGNTVPAWAGHACGILTTQAGATMTEARGIEQGADNRGRTRRGNQRTETRRSPRWTKSRE